MLKMMLCAGLGGFVGCSLRYLSGKFFGWIAPTATFPWSTFVVNLAGSLLIGVLYGLAEHHRLTSPAMSALLITGFCGGLTTFSSFANDGYMLLLERHSGLFFLYTLVSVSFGLLMVLLGRQMVR